MIGIRFFSVAFVLLMGAGVAGCQSNPETKQEMQKDKAPSTKTSELLGVSDFKVAMQEEGAQIIDVRTPVEVENGYISGARNIDISKWDTFEQEVSKLDKNKPVLVYCAVGGRSGQAASYLQKSGFTKIYDLKGGINAWKASSGELIK